MTAVVAPAREQLKISIAAMLVLVAAAILARNLSLESPLMAGDEYAYFAAAQTFPNSGERFASDPYLPRIYSPAFAAYGSVLVRLSDRPALVMKVLNTLSFVLTTLLFLGLVKRLGGVDPSPASAAVFLLLPVSAYTAYFMPETTYTLLFALLTWSIVAVLPTRVLGGAVCAGALVGTMLLVKPHALAMFVAVLLTFGALLIAPSAVRPGRRTLLAGVALFIVSTYVTLVSLNGALTGVFQPHPLAFVGGIYQPYLSQGVSLSSWTGRMELLFKILCGHMFVFVAFLAPALALGAAHLGRLYSKQAVVAADHARDRTLFVLIAFAALATFVTLGMTTNFTAQAAQTSPSEQFRLHGRYYSFVIPLFLVLYFAVARDDKRASVGDGWIRVGAVGGCVMAALLVYLQNKRIIYPFDFPEAFVFSSWSGRTRTGLAAIGAAIFTHAGIAAAMIGYGLILWRGRIALFVYPLLLSALFVLSDVGVTAWQRANSVINAPLRADARAMHDLIPPAERDRGLVIGPEWNGPLAFALFNLGSSARVLVREPESTLTDGDVPADVRWVLLIGRYTPAFRATVAWRTPQIAYLRVNTQEPTTGSRSMR